MGRPCATRYRDHREAALCSLQDGPQREGDQVSAAVCGIERHSVKRSPITTNVDKVDVEGARKRKRAALARHKQEEVARSRRAVAEQHRPFAVRVRFLQWLLDQTPQFQRQRQNHCLHRPE